ncbi:hypothetical protein E2C01_001648 [Portunus trituberculatus]|uniref:Uncharacterized protein n=1 Tax=Portunus trituberculatus TaxID=210409 RepID=A0A5B7CKY1_PORTR|nr:hypothetical protein [Portunus trituberculatus]
MGGSGEVVYGTRKRKSGRETVMTSVGSYHAISVSAQCCSFFAGSSVSSLQSINIVDLDQPPTISNSLDVHQLSDSLHASTESEIVSSGGLRDTPSDETGSWTAGMPPRDKVLFQVSADNAAGRRRRSTSVRGADGEGGAGNTFSDSVALALGSATAHFDAPTFPTPHPSPPTSPSSHLFGHTPPPPPSALTATSRTPLKTQQDTHLTQLIHVPRASHTLPHPPYSLHFNTPPHTPPFPSHPSHHSVTLCAAVITLITFAFNSPSPSLSPPLMTPSCGTHL